MSSKLVSTDEGVVKVTNVPTTTHYYRGRYYRVMRTIATTPSGFRMITANTFYGHPTALRWFYTEDGSDRAMHSHRYDSSHDTSLAPF